MNLQKIDSNIINIRIFGSYARGDNNDLSDYDILIIVKNGKKKLKTDVYNLLEINKIKYPSISYYSLSRIKEMFKEGHLFAWHLYQESINHYPNEIDPLQKLGKPKCYKNFKNDIDYFLSLLKTSYSELLNNHRNIIYEAGLIYICCRNIGLASSAFLSSHLNFSPYSPLNISKIIFPLTKNQYDILIKARYASMRGFDPPDIDYNITLNELLLIIKWATQIKSLSLENNNE